MVITVEAGVPMAAVRVRSAVAGAASAADSHFMAAAVALVVANPSTAVVDTVSVAGPVEVEAATTVVVGTVGGVGNFTPDLETTAADGISCRPLCFGAESPGPETGKGPGAIPGGSALLRCL
jgi:hypothetical protein